jgi:hypothetical protein
VARHCQIEDVIERGDLAAHAAAVGDVDERVSARREDVTGADDVGPREINDGVAVGVRARLVMQHHRLVIEAQVLEGRRVFVARQAGVAQSWTARAGRAQAREHVRVRDDLERLRAVEAGAEEIERLLRIRLGEGVVPTYVVRMQMGVDDPEHRTLEARPHFGRQARRRCGQAGVHQQNAVLAVLDGHVAASTGNHRHRALHGIHAQGWRLGLLGQQNAPV